MRRATLNLTRTAFLLLILGGATRVSAGGLDVRVGGFFPRGNDTLWGDVCALYMIDGCSDAAAAGQPHYKGNAGAFKGLSGGVEFNTVVYPNVELGVHVDGSGRTVDSSYRDYEDEDGFPIEQRLRLAVIPVGATLRLIPTNKRARFAPYVGGGVDAVYYRFEEYGDLIDFGDPDLNYYDDSFEADGVAFGAHAVAGLRVYVNRDFAIVGEGRYQWAKHDMGDDFAPNEPGLVNRIDLSGASFAVGLHVRF